MSRQHMTDHCPQSFPKPKGDETPIVVRGPFGFGAHPAVNQPPVTVPAQADDHRRAVASAFTAHRPPVKS